MCFALAIVGHLPGGASALDAVSLGRAWFNLTAVAPGFGLLAGLRTLCPQAVGAKRPRLNQLYVQRALLVTIVFSVPLCGLQFSCSWALAKIGHPPELGAAAQAYAVRLIPMYFGVSAMTILQRVFQAHDLVLSNMAICGLVCAVAPMIQWHFVRTLHLGFLGAAWAASAFNALYVFLQVFEARKLPMSSCEHTHYAFNDNNPWPAI